MSNADAGAIALIITGMIAAVWFWNERVRRVQLEVFGLEAVKQVLRWEPENRRREILARGWMTSHEWTSMNRRQAAMFDVELQRRANEQDHDSKS